MLIQTTQDGKAVELQHSLEGKIAFILDHTPNQNASREGLLTRKVMHGEGFIHDLYDDLLVIETTGQRLADFAPKIDPKMSFEDWMKQFGHTLTEPNVIPNAE